MFFPILLRITLILTFLRSFLTGAFSDFRTYKQLIYIVKSLILRKKFDTIADL